jgi:hypothetical protein
MVWLHVFLLNMRMNRYALGLNIIVSVLFVLAVLNLAPGPFQMASALKSHTSCGSKTTLADGYFTIECCSFDTDDGGNIVGSPKCVKYICKPDGTGCTATQRPSKLTQDLVPPAGSLMGPGDNGGGSSPTTGGILTGGNNTKIFTGLLNGALKGGETVGNNTNTTGIPALNSYLKLHGQKTGSLKGFDNSTN